MESDLINLQRRINRLEILIGATKTKENCITALRTAQSGLRSKVPDEMAAAHRAITLLSILQRGGAQTSHRKTDNAHDLIEHVLPQLTTLQTLCDNARDAHHLPPGISRDMRDCMRCLHARLQKLDADLYARELAIDDLLTGFDAATARLNSAILALARRVRHASSDGRPSA